MTFLDAGYTKNNRSSALKERRLRLKSSLSLKSIQVLSILWSSIISLNCFAQPIQFQLIGSHPIAAVATETTHHNIHALAAWQGRIYMGVGHWNNRPGPISLVSYDPAAETFNIEHSVGSDAIAIFRPIRSRLFVPSIDPAHFRETIDYVVHDGTSWEDRSPVGPLHMFDMASLNGSDVWAVGGSSRLETTPGGPVVYRSQDDGETWANVTPPSNTAGSSRYFWCVPYKGSLHIRAQAFDGTSWNPTVTAPLYFNKATVLQTSSAEVVVGRASVAPGVSISANTLSNDNPRLTHFDGSTFTSVATQALDFAIHENKVYTIQEQSGTREILVYDDIALPAQVPTTGVFTDIPNDAISIAIDKNIVWLGTASGNLYAAALPGTEPPSILTESPAVAVEQADRFGTELSADGEWLAVGAPYQPGVQPETGAVHLFHDLGNSGSLTFHSKLEPPLANQSDARFFGRSIALSGNLLAVAETGTPSTGPNRGENSRVYIYQLQGNDWTLFQELSGNWIQSVELEGDWLATSRHTSPAFEDFCDFYKFNGSTFELTQPVDLAAMGLNSDVRWPLITPAILGDRAVVGIGGDLTFFGGPGEVWIASPNGEDLWDFENAIKLINYTPAGSLSPIYANGFGRSLSLDGDFLAIGAPADDNGAPQAGAVTVMELRSTYTRVDIPAEEPIDEGRFGQAVLLRNGFLFVGAPGASNSLGTRGAVYQYECAGDSWEFMRKIEPDRIDLIGFGAALAVSGNTLIIGSEISDPEISPAVSRLTLVPDIPSKPLYSNWIVSFGIAGADAAPEANAEGDYFSNILDYALGRYPNLTESIEFNQLALSGAIEDNQSVLRWRQRVGSAMQGLSYSIEHSEDIENWSPMNLAEMPVTNDGGTLE